MKNNLFGFDVTSWLEENNLQTKDNSKSTHFYIFPSIDKLGEKETKLIPNFKLDKISKKKGPHLVELQSGDHWFIHLESQSRQKSNHWGYLGNSDFSHARDTIGSLVPKLNESSHLYVHFFDVSENSQLGTWCGLEVGSYKYHDGDKCRQKDLPKIHLEKKYDELKKDGAKLGASVNIARHLVNMPAMELTPKTLAKQVENIFDGMYGCEVNIWDEKKLKAEKMNLHVSVGQAAEDKSVLVHIKYRPPKLKTKPSDCLAFVGKGITFDSGGLDIKPASGMRLMKKDKGGAASVIGLAHWVANTKLQKPCDFYLALAENAISSNAFRPGDVIKSRSGIAVEIHNTDAEGRLVMADVLTLAAEQKPAAIIDLATLTGAMRVAVGLDISGMLSNHDGLATLALKCSQERGDPVWRLPLFKPYNSSLKSDFADISNCAPSGYGGAISAALFLEKFTKNVPWLHFDFMAYTHKPSGALTSPGGSGQLVQTLSKFLEDFSVEKFEQNLKA